MAEITIKHYRSAHARAREKELIAERVTEGSETAQFLKKMEVQRIRRPCFETIDMRGKVPGECQKYLLNNRVFYLDDTSYAIYQQGLKAYNGSFTLGTYEAIVNGGHTNRALREARAERERAEQRQTVSAAHATAKPTAPNAAEGAAKPTDSAPELYQPELIPLGYFKRRREERLQYVTAVQIQHDGQLSNGTTRDISVSGLQIVCKGMHRFAPGTELILAFPALQEQEGRADLSNLRYRVIAGEQRDAEYHLRVQLAAESAPEGFEAFIRELIERYKRKYKLDVEDDYWSVCSWLYERVYSESAMQLAFFVSASPEHQLVTQAVAVTDGNQPFAHFFRNDVDNFDFSPLCLPARLERLRKDREFLLMLYREKVGNEYRLHSVADFELPDESAVKAMLRFTLAHEEHCVAKVVASEVPLHPLSPGKFDMLTGRLQDKAADEVATLRERLAALLFTGTVIDITAQMQSAFSRHLGLERGQIDVQGLHCWVGATRKQLPLYQEVERLAVVPAPELIRFGYVERRREDRYLAETAVEVLTRNARIKGRTRDISKRGLAVRIEQAVEFAVGEELRIALTSLQAKRPSLDLSQVPYRIVKIDSQGGAATLMLERVRDKYEHEIDDFFVELITKNRHKLAVDINDTRGATQSRVYEGTAAENVGTVPFFIARREDGGARLQAVAVPEGEHTLAEFFRDADRQHDFAWLSQSRLILALYQQMGRMAREAGQQRNRPSPIELEIYCYKHADAQGRTVLHVATELEFAGDEPREAFIAAALAAPEHRVIKLMATYALDFNKTELDAVIDTIRAQSRHRAGKLHDAIGALVGVGELIDITAQYRRGRELAQM